jgi:dihydroflavonol-4-reductase
MADPSTALVTGGTGFVGRFVVRALLAEGRKVRLLCRQPAKARALFGENVEVFTGNLLDAASVAAACRGVGLALNLAGLYEFGARHRAAMWATNVAGTEHLLAACASTGVQRIVHCSTAGILTPNGDSPEPPQFPARPPFGCHYKRSKWEGERRSLAWATRGLPVMIASPTALLGAEDERPTPTGRMVVDLLAGRFPACSRTGLNVIAVEDVASGILAIADRGRPGERYLLGNRNLWLAELLHIIAAAAGVKAPRAVVPWAVIALAGLAGEAWGLATGSGNSRLCLETAHFARRRQFFDHTATTAALGWTPRKTIEAAAADAVAWVRQHATGTVLPAMAEGAPQTSA